MRPTARFAFTLLGLGLALLPVSFIARGQDNSPAKGNLSNVRIVRLSFVEGTVTVKRPDMADWAASPVNTPIQAGFKLSTAEKSFAEVEFENTSTARLGQLSLLDFDQLAATPSGGKVNRLVLEQGYATFNVVPEGVEAFEAKAQDTTVTFAAATPTRFRIDIDDGAVRVEVFKGAADVSSPYGQQTLTQDMVVEIRPGAQPAFNVTEGITKDAWDEWVDERENQLSMIRNSPGPNNGGSYYGWNDLSNYGDWNYFPGYGYGWSPFAGIGWSPFMAGQWCWYPGMGYTWISFEPWGWLPYHFGGWQFYPGLGWAWFPGSFGAWSPGTVAWWQGPGWVGWSPLPPRGRPGVGTANCPNGQTCGRVIVRPGTVQEGRPVKAGLVSADFSAAKLVPKLDIQPGKGGMLPGAPSPAPALALAVRQGLPGIARAQVTSGSNTVVVGGPAGAKTSEPRPVNNALGVGPASLTGSGVVFNSDTGRYENNPQVKPSQVSGPVAATAPQNANEDHGAPALAKPGLSAVPSSTAPSNAQGAVAPAGKPAWSGHESAAPVARPSHSEAPSSRPSSSQAWGGSRSGSSSGSSGSAWGHSSGGTSSGGWGSSHSSGGGSMGSSGGGGHSGGSGGGHK